MKRQILVGLALANSVRLFVVVTLSVLAGWTFHANAQTVTNLYSFVGYATDGQNPEAALVQGSDGNFYGTTYGGGTSNNCPGGCGAVFRINPSGGYTNLYSFVGSPTDGKNPQAGLVQGSDGNFYGTTEIGGMGQEGTVFQINPSGGYSNLYAFGNQRFDGYQPRAGLVQGSDGNFYGTTYVGGRYPLGTVFRISPGGNYTNLYSFGASPDDGSYPAAGLVQGSDGNFYGTTHTAGTGAHGTVFRISPSGSCTSLYSFVGSPNDGAAPYAGLVQGSDGNFYGTTSQGGTIGDNGTVFRISPSGSYTSLYSFAGYPTDGAAPYAGLVQGSDGNFYGTTSQGGTSGHGTVFRISPSGSYTSLYSFAGYPTDGDYPDAGLVQGSDGNFYGTTYSGGTSTNCFDGCGTVFKLTVSLTPPPNQISATQIAGNDVTFSIPSVACETYQLQFTTDLTSGTWSNVPGVSVTNSIGALLTLTNSGGAVGSQGFYRFAITP
jgi:uncharacterized repeat protein (TIGR03803 family)